LFHDLLQSSFTSKGRNPASARCAVKTQTSMDE
jgi:hypothetical protein